MSNKITKPPLLLIHGMGRLHFSMAHLVPIARLYGYSNIINFSYPSSKGRIGEHAQELSKVVAALGSTFHCITHSLGSIIFREVVSSMSADRTGLIRCVMLGPPNQGAKVASVVLKSKLLRTHFGPPLEELASGGFPPLPSTVAVGVIAGALAATRSLNPLFDEPNDLIVGVSETVLEGSRDHRIMLCPHGLLMYSPWVIKEAFYFLEHESFTKQHSE